MTMDAPCSYTTTTSSGVRPPRTYSHVQTLPTPTHTERTHKIPPKSTPLPSYSFMGDRPGGPGGRNPSGRGSSRSGTPQPPSNDASRVGLLAQIANAPCPVKDVKSAHTYLTDKSCITSKDDLDPQKLIDILLAASIVKGVPNEVIAAIRAVAFIIQDTSRATEPQALYDQLESKMMGSMQTLTDTLAASFSVKLEETRKFMDALVIAQADATLKISQAVEKCVTLSSTMSSTTDTLTRVAASTPAPPQGPRSWADVASAPAAHTTAAQHPYDRSEPPELTRFRQRLLLRARMIMIEPSSLIDLPAADIRDKANSWLEEIDQAVDEETKPKTVIKAAIPQPRGGLLLELDSVESANRFRYYITTNQDLAEKFGPEAAISKQTHKLIFRFIPCDGDFNPSDPNHIREVEERAGIEPFSIKSMTWCRPENKRAPNQSFANASVIVNSARAGNQLLHGDLYICDKRITIQKDVRHPVLCNKCQQYGHIRRDCTNDTRCVICSGPHDVSSCNDREKPCCVSCGPTSHHTTNATHCPDLQRRRDDLRRRFPEDTMPFFPIYDDSTTWVQAPAAAPAMPPQPEYNRPPRQEYHQNNNQRRAAPGGANELFYRQQSLHEVNERARIASAHQMVNAPYYTPDHTPNHFRPPPAPNARRAPTPVLPSQPRDDSIDREIMDTETLTTGRHRNGLPPKPPATYEDSLPQTVSP